MSTFNAKEIKNLRATAVRSLIGEEGGFIMTAEGVVTFDEGTTQFTDEQITAEMNRIQQVWNDEQYMRDRASSYPDIKDQLDMLYWDQINGTTVWKDAIDSVKNQYPKPIV